MQNPQVIRSIGERRKSSITAQGSPKTGDAGLASSLHNLHFQNEHPFLSFFDSDGERQTLSLKEQPLVTLGTQKSCDVRVSVSSASRIHAQIRLDENDQVWLDSRSDSTPCKVNGARVAEPVQLRQGDCIDVGGRVVVYGEHAPPAHRKNAAPAPPPPPAPADDNDGWQVRVTEAMSPMTAAAVELRSESSPVGSEMLARKLRAQVEARAHVEARRTLAMSALPVSALSPGAEEPPLAAYKAHAMPLGDGLLHSALLGACEARRAYNQATYSPSMGCSEEEQERLRAEYLASLPAGSPERAEGSTPGEAYQHTPGTPSSDGVEACVHGGIALFRKDSGGLADAGASRQAYNKTVYSPSMGMPEADVAALRAAESRASSAAHTSEYPASSRSTTSDEGGESEEEAVEAGFECGIVPFHALRKGALNSHITSDDLFIS